MGQLPLGYIPIFMQLSHKCVPHIHLYKEKFIMMALKTIQIHELLWFFSLLALSAHLATFCFIEHY